ncbi:hypothetical protein ACFL0M_00650 [Thermodesulfobacteriota bacterium]
MAFHTCDIVKGIQEIYLDFFLPSYTQENYWPLIVLLKTLKTDCPASTTIHMIKILAFFIGLKDKNLLSEGYDMARVVVCQEQNASMRL